MLHLLKCVLDYEIIMDWLFLLKVREGFQVFEDKQEHFIKDYSIKKFNILFAEQRYILFKACSHYLHIIYVYEIYQLTYMYRSSNTAYGANHRGHSVNYRASSMISNKPTGLENLTNTCYISAVLQMLFLILPESLNKKKGDITELFFRLKASKSISDYKLLKRAVEKQIPIVQGFQQQDAQEFLLGLLEILNQQNCLGLKRGSNINLDYNEKLDIMKNHKAFVTQMLKMQNSSIIQLFYAQQVHRFTCIKGHEKFKFEKYQCLSLNFPDTPKASSIYSYSSSHSAIELEKLIAKCLGAEQISGLLCQKCKKNTDFKKQSYLYTTPKYLFLHLARFKQGYYNHEKINTTVDYDEFLKIYDQSLKEQVKYRLLATVNHYGSLNRGHYYAELRWKDGHWYQLNDEDVRTCQVQTSGNSSKYVYILCYQKVS